MALPLSLHGAKPQTLARIHQNLNEKATTAPHYSQLDSKFLSHIQTNSIRPPIHEDFNSFLASSALHIQKQFSETTQIASVLQNHRFEVENTSSQIKNSDHKPKTIPEIKLESTTHLNKGNVTSPETAKLLEVLSSAPAAQPPKYTMDKGYGSRTTTDPLIALACSTDVEQISMGLVNAVHERSQHKNNENDSHKFNESNHKVTKASIKPDSALRNEHAQLLRREEIEVLRDVKEKFQQQLNAQHPHITVPLKHPEGIIDIHMRFDRKIIGYETEDSKGSIRVMFSGSNAQVVKLFAQHREEFMNIILKEGYAIDPSRMQFQCPSLQKSITI